MFPMEPMEKLASISASFQKTSKVSISVTLFQVLKDLAEISASLGLSGDNNTMCFDVFGPDWQKSRI